MGIVKALSPLVLGIAKRNKTAGNLAYNALSTGAKIGKTAVKAAPVAGAGLTAVGTYAGYQDAVSKGEDPGRAAFKGIGGVIGGVAGGIGGGAIAGPVGGFAGYMGGDYAGEKVAGKIYDSLSNGYNQPMPAPLTVAEQRAIRQRRAAQGGRNPNPLQGGIYDVNGFRYSQGADTGLVGLRMQQQAQNINAVQGYSTAKHLSNNQLRGTLGQQQTDRYAVGQMSQTDRLGILQGNLTERYGIGRTADVENNRTRGTVQLGLGEQYTQRYGIGRNAQRDETLGLGQQYTQRYAIGRNAQRDETLGLGQQYTQRYAIGRNAQRDETLGLGQQYTQRYGISRQADNDRYGLETGRQLGNRGLDNQKYDLTRGYDLKDRERADKRLLGMRSLDLRGQELDNNFAINGLNIFSGFYR